MRRVTGLFVAIGFTLGLAVSVASWPSWASRNSSGTYSLPGSALTTGATITASEHNAFRNDVATELTNSLDRNGRGAMLAALQAYSGTAAAPGLTFSGDTDLGMYRAGANDMRLVCGSSTEVQKWTDSLVTISKSVLVTGNSAQAGVAATGGTGGGAGVTGTGSGSGGNGGTFTGTSGSPGLVATGNGVGNGITSTGGTTSGKGISATGGGTGVGGAFTGGSGGAIGVTGTGTSTSAGASFANGTAATGGTRQDALVVTNGDISLSGVANPTSTTAISNRVTPKNVAKAWAKLVTTGGGSTTTTVSDGFNVSAAANAANVSVSWGTAFSSSDYAIVVTPWNSGLSCSASGNTTAATIICYDITAGAVPFSAFNFQTGASKTLSIVAYGAQ